MVDVELARVVLLLVLEEVVVDGGEVLRGAFVLPSGHPLLQLKGSKGLSDVEALLLGHVLVPPGVLLLRRWLREVVHRRFLIKFLSEIIVCPANVTL